MLSVTFGTILTYVKITILFTCEIGLTCLWEYTERATLAVKRFLTLAKARSSDRPLFSKGHPTLLNEADRRLTQRKNIDFLHIVSQITGF